MDDQGFWELERSFWIGDVAQFRDRMAPDCIMVFPDPVGVLSSGAIIESLASAPRWGSLDISGEHLMRIGDAFVILAYRAEGRREGAEPYRALCSSSYVKLHGEWRLAQHQQTPL